MTQPNREIEHIGQNLDTCLGLQAVREDLMLPLLGKLWHGNHEKGDAFAQSQARNIVAVAQYFDPMCT